MQPYKSRENPDDNEAYASNAFKFCFADELCAMVKNAIESDAPNETNDALSTKRTLCSEKKIVSDLTQDIKERKTKPKLEMVQMELYIDSLFKIFDQFWRKGHEQVKKNNKHRSCEVALACRQVEKMAREFRDEMMSCIWKIAEVFRQKHGSDKRLYTRVNKHLKRYWEFACGIRIEFEKLARLMDCKAKIKQEIENKKVTLNMKRKRKELSVDIQALTSLDIMEVERSLFVTQHMKLGEIED